MRKFGYARVSANEQLLDCQVERLIKVGCEKHRIITDKTSGSSIEREGIETLMIKLEKGDVLYVTSLDRLGRNTVDMVQLVNKLHEMEVSVHFLEEGISTDGEMGLMVITILSAVAQAERTRILERTNEGRIAAKSKGVKFGRKRSIDRKKIIQMKKERYGVTEISKTLGVSRGSVYKTLNEDKEP